MGTSSSFPLSRWLTRSTIILAVTVLLAALDATALRPPTPARKRPAPTAQTTAPTQITDSTTPADSQPPTAIATDGTLTIEAMLEHYENGTAMFVDARPIAQYREGHVQGALHLDVDAFRRGRPAVLDVLPPDYPVIIYCGGGECDASHMVQRMLEAEGYTQLMIFEPGFPAWVQAGHPVEEGDPPV